MRQFCSQKNTAIPQEYDEIKAYSAWNVAQSNPCFEIWLYYHFYENKPVSDEVAKHASFKEYVNNTISGGFNFEKDPVRLETAIEHAEKNFQQDKDSKLLDYSSEVYILGKEIDGFVKAEIAKLVNKLK